MTTISPTVDEVEMKVNEASKALERRVVALRAASRTIWRISHKARPLESKDGLDWAAAAAVLRAEGVPVCRAPWEKLLGFQKSLLTV
jgi:signal transduction histidine kinase